MAGGIFGNMFDLNRDGKLDSIERAMDYMLFDEMIQEDERSEDAESDSEDDF